MILGHQYLPVIIQETLKKLKGEDPEDKKLNRKRKRPKGPNPLSCKKKKGEGETKKKKKTKKVVQPSEGSGDKTVASEQEVK